MCLGTVGEMKRSGAVVELFKALKGSGVETCYIGGAGMWGGYESTKRDLALHREIESVADIFIENATQQKTAEMLNTSSYYAHVSHHDVSSIGCQENMSAGNVVFGLLHPILAERTPYRFNNVQDLATAIADYPFQSEQHEMDVSKMTSKSNEWSYQSWIEQIDSILRIIT